MVLNSSGLRWSIVRTVDRSGRNGISSNNLGLQGSDLELFMKNVNDVGNAEI